MISFCFIKISPSQLPGPVVRVRCDPEAQQGTKFWGESRTLGLLTFVLRKFHQLLSGSEKERGKFPSGPPIKVLSFPNVA